MNELRGIEIFASGTHNGDAYSERDLDAMVEAFHALDFKPALRIGHASPGENESETPAIGWVENLRREGNKLLADFVNIADEVMAAIQKKSFTRVSSEVFWNFERAGRKFSRVLKAVALLGVGIPGVAGLKPLTPEQYAALFGSAAAKAYTADLNYPSKEKEMDEKEVQRIAREAATAATAEAEKKFQLQLDAEKKAREDAEKKHADEMAAQKKQFDAAQLAASQGRIKSLADTCKMPALRPFVAAFAEAMTTAPQEKKYTIGQDKDKKDVQVSGMEAVEKFVSEINAKVERLYKQTGAAHVEGANDDPVGEKSYLDSREAAGVEVDKRARELMGKDSKLEYQDAMERVTAADPELAQAYAARAIKAA